MNEKIPEIKNNGEKKKITMTERIARYATAALAVVGAGEAVAGATSNKEVKIGNGEDTQIRRTDADIERPEVLNDINKLANGIVRDGADLDSGVVKNADDLAARETARRLAEEGFTREVKE